MQRAVTQRGSGAARGPRTEGARYARLPGAELSDARENGSVLNGSKPEDPNRDLGSSSPCSFLPGSNAGGVDSGNPQVERGASGPQKEVNQASAWLGRFTDVKCCPVGDGGSSR